ncbi:phosphoglycerate kinase [Methylovirgula ligni]|uniref:Phosphoglycerate kinase n=1 Tax=Methylovirgula ligni TaxID=569860 RepID=A0A3D9YXT0_9HYPH|nr:phosphoglycerate kinase [Methylovirgula ligni]QAY95864.1 phosphoglycerate kinase [Methylovirgula ligni]REF86491.1 phosphoglycerate kinase [Methylovirgula ligni]
MTRTAPLAPFPILDDAQLAGKRVLIRVDLNVPMDGAKVTDATRIDRILPNLQEIAAKGAKVIILSHLGRPKGREEKYSLRPVVAELSARLGKPVAFAADCIDEEATKAVAAMRDGDFLLLENTRFHAGEEKNGEAFIDQLAVLGDVYVNDAFSCAHRAHASTEGLARRLPSFAGRSMQVELEILTNLLSHPVRPVMAVVGGAKVSTKLELLGNLMRRVDILVIGGGMANTFLAAQGKKIGKSICEMELADVARQIMAEAAAENCELVLPVDVVVAQKFAAGAPSRVISVDEVGDEDMILDIGPKSAARVELLLEKARTLVWNGPFGAFEISPFDKGTTEIAAVAARLTRSGQLESIAGGGDTIAALNKADAAKDFTYISTAGGAFLEWLEGKKLPGVEALRLNARRA